MTKSTATASTSNHETQRRGVVTAAQMDAVGQFDQNDDDDTTTNNNNNNSLKKKQTPPPSPPQAESSNSNIVSMEIGHEEEEEEEDFDADLERLLGDSSATVEEAPASRICYYKIGNVTVWCPKLYEKTGVGVIGPHWFGPLCTMGLALWGGLHFVSKGNKIGPVTHVTCILFTLVMATLLFLVATKDPGIVRKDFKEGGGDWRWCDFCKVHQPPDGSHCPDCQVCVAGYDHHCVWMGTCVGKGNFGFFKWFNLSWLIYLIYAIVWVTIVGPEMFGNKGNDEGGDGENNNS